MTAIEAAAPARERGELPDFLLIIRAFAGFIVVVFHVYGGGIVNGATQATLIEFGGVSFSWILSGAGQAGVYLFLVL